MWRWLSSGWWRTVVLGVIAMGAAVALYAPSVTYQLAPLDDLQYTMWSDVVRDGFTWGGLRGAFTKAPENYWAPLLWMSFMVDWEVSGGLPWSFHLQNVFWFALNVGLLYALAWRWTGRRRWVALAAALLWLTHPARVESVAWVVERKDVLSGFFFLLGLGLYVEARRGRGAVRPEEGGAASAPFGVRHGVELAWLCMLLGGMAKQIVIVFPAALVLLDVWPLNRTTWGRLWRDVWRLVFEKWAFWALAVGYAILPIAFHVATDAVISVSAGHRALMIPNHYLFYFGKLLWPTGLMPLQADLPFSWIHTAAGAAVIFGGMAALWPLRRRAPWALWGWLWFIGLLFPLSGVVWAGQERLATRFFYIPHIGLSVAIALAAAALAHRGRAARRTVAGILAAVVALGTGLSLDTLRHWKTSEEFALRVLECHPGHPTACWLGGDAHLERGDWVKAADAYSIGVLQAEDINCFMRLCYLQNSMGRPDLTKDLWGQYAVMDGEKLREEYDNEHINREMLWRLYAQWLYDDGQTDKAMNAFRKGMEFAKDSPDSFIAVEYIRAGLETGRTNEVADAIAAVKDAKGIEIREWRDLLPFYEQLWLTGAFGAAFRFFDAYAMCHPDDARALNNMAWLLGTTKTNGLDHVGLPDWPAAAVAWAEEANRLNGESRATNWDTVGAARANARDFPGAVRAAEKALGLARSVNDRALADEIEDRLALYRVGKDWKDPTVRQLVMRREVDRVETSIPMASSDH